MLTDKTAVITESTSGIGLAVAQQLAAQGANIVLHGAGDTKEIEKIRVNIELQNDVKAYYIHADLSQAHTTRQFIDQAIQLMGGVDVLVNSAYAQPTDRMETLAVEDWDQLIALNLSAVFHATAAALPAMQKQGWGRIINITAGQQQSLAMISKEAVVGLTKATGLENAGSGITCNAVCPSFVREPFVSPEQLAGAVVFLCSEAAQQITGTSLALDGGWTAC